MKRLILVLCLVTVCTLAMPSRLPAQMVLRYVDTDIVTGGDGQSWATAYATLKAWSLAEVTDLVSSGTSHTVYCRGEADDTLAVVVDDWTVDSTHYITIQGNNFDGLPDSGYYLNVDDDYAPALTIAENYTRVFDLEVTNSHNNANGGLLGSGTYLTIERCIFRDCGSSAEISYAGLRIIANSSARNCLLYGNEYAGLIMRGSGATAINCTSVGNGSGFYVAFQTATLTNCLGAGNSSADFREENPGDSSPMLYCASGDNSLLADGMTTTSCRVGQTFTFIDALGHNYQLTTDDLGAKGHGVNKSSEFPDDITGATRTLPWDIGAFKAVVDVAAGEFFRIYNGIGAYLIRDGVGRTTRLLRDGEVAPAILDGTMAARSLIRDGAI